MKLNFRPAIPLMIGIGLGGLIATLTSAAPTQPVYIVTEVDEVRDVESYETLKKTMAGVVEAQLQDGRYLARTENIKALDGAAPKGIVIIAFESEAKAKAYHENTKESSALRKASSKSRSFIVSLCSDRGKLLPEC